MIIINFCFLFMCIITKIEGGILGMSHKSVTEIAQDIQISLSVVSKVMHHRGGVHADQRYRVYRYLSDHSIRVPTPADVGIYAILPDTPVFFWREMASYLRNECFTPQDKINLYSSITADQENEYLIIKYLEHAQRCRAKCILLAAAFSPAVLEAVHSVSRTTPVFLLSEDGNLLGERIFFIGSDARKDGIALAEYYAGRYPAPGKILILSYKETINHVRRVEGFIERLRQSGGYRLQQANPPLFREKDFSSHLARMLQPIWEQFPFDCIFSPDGYTPYVCGAIMKLGKEGQVRCLGFENAPLNQQYVTNRILDAIVKQDVAGQARLATELAGTYCKSGVLPGKRDHCVPSEFILF